MFFFVPAAVSVAPQVYKIVEIDRTVEFAGKLGSEVRETWRVSRDGQDVTVLVSPYHTHVAGTPARFEVGDTVTLTGAAKAGRIHIRIAQARH